MKSPQQQLSVVILTNWHLSSRAWGIWNGEPEFRKDCKEKWNGEACYLLSPGGGIQHEGGQGKARGRGPAAAQAFMRGCWQGALEGSGWSWRGQFKPNTAGILASLLRALSKVSTGEGPGHKENAYHKGHWKSHVRNLHLLVTLWAMRLS